MVGFNARMRMVVDDEKVFMIDLSSAWKVHRMNVFLSFLRVLLFYHSFVQCILMHVKQMKATHHILRCQSMEVF